MHFSYSPPFPPKNSPLFPSFFDKSLQTKLNTLRNPKKPIFQHNSSMNFYPTPEKSEKKAFSSTFTEKFSHSLEKFQNPSEKTPETAQKRPQSSHYSSSRDIKSLEKDIEKLKKDNMIVAQKLDRYIQAQYSNERGQNLFTFVNNSGGGLNNISAGNFLGFFLNFWEICKILPFLLGFFRFFL